jgi:serine/threonine protein kinase
MLKMFSDNAHPHLISLLATYEQRGVYHLIFPWADHDLNSFWKIYKPSPTFDATTVKWFAKQCMGIAQALVKIHKYQTSNSDGENGFRAKIYVRHGDIKPTNILWFPDDNGGILKITDFGLSESTNHSKSYRSNTKVAASMSYRPPEYDIKGASLGLSYDIWTLGCLYLEFITWLLGTWTMVEDFLEMRTSPDPFLYKWDTDTFFELVPGTNSRGENTIGARVKPAVVEVCTSPSCPVQSPKGCGTVDFAINNSM